MAALTIRRAMPADLPAVVAMLADDRLGEAREDASEPLHPGYRAAFDTINASPNDALYVAEAGGAEAGGALVGCFQLTFLPGLSQRGAWRGQIEGVRVSAGSRGTGLGGQMIGWAVERCREKGCRVVQLTTNAVRTDAQRFYRSLGFKGSHVGMKLDLP